MKKKALYILATFCCMLFIVTLHAQTSPIPTVLNNKSERSYTDYEGKIIRNIILTQLGFEKVFTDTSRVIRYYGTKILNNLHTDTRDWVIRNNLFIKPGTPLNQYMVADNERYLRSLEFIQDARIIARPIKGVTDSVDLEVITKDFFSITGAVEFGGRDRQKFRIAENNLAGEGQKVQLTALVDRERSPSFGYDLLYTKNSVGYTFVSATVGFTKINVDPQGDEGVQSLYLQLSRPLVSPYSRVAGGFQITFNKSYNAYQKPARLYHNFANSVVDVWAGYNVGVKRLISNNNYRKRAFIGLRYLSQNFSTIPFQIGNTFSPYYNNKNALLGELTLFRQEFYKTNFIYGFGTTEDIPYGYNISITGGLTKQLDVSRPYVGFNVNRYIVTPKNEFLQGFVRVGGFPNDGRVEDVGLLAGCSFYSKLNVMGNTKSRHYLRFSYTRIVNSVTSEPLRINNALGLQYFSADSLTGKRRISAYGETFLFLKYKVFGFLLAPFAFAETSFFTPENQGIFKSTLYKGMGGGIRTRNENLSLGTIELRFIYFPTTVQNLNPFRISFRSNIRFRHNNNYVRAPNIVQLNTDEANSFF